MKIKSKVKPSSLVCVALSLGFTPFPAPAILDGRSGVWTPREGGERFEMKNPLHSPVRHENPASCIKSPAKICTLWPFDWTCIPAVFFPFPVCVCHILYTRLYSYDYDAYIYSCVATAPYHYSLYVRNSIYQDPGHYISYHINQSIYLSIYLPIYIWMYIYIQICVCIYIYPVYIYILDIYIYICIYVCVYIYYIILYYIIVYYIILYYIILYYSIV